MNKLRTTYIAWSLWLPVALAFICIIFAWIHLIQLAQKEPMEYVPLEVYTDE